MQLSKRCKYSLKPPWKSWWQHGQCCFLIHLILEVLFGKAFTRPCTWRTSYYGSPFKLDCIIVHALCVMHFVHFVTNGENGGLQCPMQTQTTSFSGSTYAATAFSQKYRFLYLFHCHLYSFQRKIARSINAGNPVEFLLLKISISRFTRA